jgi:hypothetical protein
MKTLASAILLSFCILPTLFALDPPPGGGYPGGNTALGDNALFNQPADSEDLNNTAIGYEALYNNTDGGFGNVALGYESLVSNTTGEGNTAGGWQSLYGNTTGGENTALGISAMLRNTTGFGNVAVGDEALWYNTFGERNVGIGQYAGGGITGDYNVAVGAGALGNAGGGRENVALGYSALSYCKGSHNIALGTVAGVQVIQGSHNIDIGNQGTAEDGRTIRIGIEDTQKRTFIAGIAHAHLPATIPVVINQDGQLGTASSSSLEEENIQPMENGSDVILSLRPVTFRYKKELDSLGTPQFGLVAEQVAKVDPDLVARDESGRPYTVRYDAVNAMLLNEFLKEHRKVETLEAKVAKLEAMVEK